MAIHDVWFANLKTLIDAEGGGRRGIRAVADASGLSEEYVYQLAHKKPNSKGVPREIGKDAAKKIATAFSKGRGESWFDSIPALTTNTSNFKPNQPLAVESIASGAININEKRLVKPTAQVVVAYLSELLAGVEPGRMGSVIAALADLARSPHDEVIRDSLARLTAPSEFTQKNQSNG